MLNHSRQSTKKHSWVKTHIQCNINILYYIILNIATELLLGPAAVQVDPDLPVDVVAHTRVLLRVQPVQCPTHNYIDLQGERRLVSEVCLVESVIGIVF